MISQLATALECPLRSCLRGIDGRDAAREADSRDQRVSTEHDVVGSKLPAALYLDGRTSSKHCSRRVRTRPGRPSPRVHPAPPARRGQPHAGRPRARRRYHRRRPCAYRAWAGQPKMDDYQEHRLCAGHQPWRVGRSRRGKALKRQHSVFQSDTLPPRPEHRAQNGTKRQNTALLQQLIPVDQDSSAISLISIRLESGRSGMWTSEGTRGAL
jgi:hypothetical protein